MPDRSFVIVAVIAFLAPFVRELLPPLGIPEYRAPSEPSSTP